MSGAIGISLGTTLLPFDPIWCSLHSVVNLSNLVEPFDKTDAYLTYHNLFDGGGGIFAAKVPRSLTSSTLNSMGKFENFSTAR